MYRSNRCPVGGGLFLMMDAAKREAVKSGLDLIDCSVGASDLPSPVEALQTLSESVHDASTHSCKSLLGQMNCMQACVCLLSPITLIRLPQELNDAFPHLLRELVREAVPWDEAGP